MAARRWYKGNTHTHTTYSDGDSPPEVVVDWYAEHGYDFLFLTDHNAVVPDDHLARLQRRGLAVYQGEEITMAAVHVNGLGLRRTILPGEPGSNLAEPYTDAGKSERVRWAVDQAQAQHGVAVVNHPFFADLSADDLLASGDFEAFEVANGHHSEGHRVGRGQPSTDMIWDRLLAAGRRVVGLAADDAHHFRSWGPRWANPGRGWIQVEAESPRLTDCLAALRGGRFYASTGLELADYRAGLREVVVALDGPLDGQELCIELVGDGGRILDGVEGAAARFAIAPSVGPYVRVRACSADGRQLWAQPQYL